MLLVVKICTNETTEIQIVKKNEGLNPYQPNIDAALAWLRRSIAVTSGKGASHSYSPLWGWAKAYPETTGYLLPTLLQFADIRQDESLRELAQQCQDWLCTVQLPSGAFPGGMVGNSRPSTFNTAMILFGLGIPVKKILAEEDEMRLRKTTHSALDWLIDYLNEDGAWQQAAYVPGFVPTYYSYAVWSVLKGGATLDRPEVREKMLQALQFYSRRFQPDGTVLDWGFRPGRTAFTHTIAYTLQGFLESALLLNESDILERTIHSADRLLAEYERVGRVAGRYGLAWQGDYSFTCPTGNAQLSILYFRIWEISGQERYWLVAERFLGEAARFQQLGSGQNTYGALPGSAPFWGPYMRFRYPGWGVKFFLDGAALLGLDLKGSSLKRQK